MRSRSCQRANDSSLAPERRREARVSAGGQQALPNRRYDHNELALEFQELLELDLDFALEITGFSRPEIEALGFGEV